MQTLKRLLSLLLVFTMLSALLPATALAATNAPIRDADETTSASHCYVEAVEKAIEVVESLYGGTGHGALYDVNDDGIQELILLHDDWMSYREGATPVVKYSIFTMADGNAVLLHEETLFTHESGWYGQLSIVQQNGQVYLATTSSTESGSRYHAHWTLYQLEGTNLVQKSDVKYYLQEDYLDNYNKKVNSEESYTQIDGKKSSYRDFEKWKDTIDVLLTVDYYDAYETAYGKSMSLNDLLQLLKNDPSIIGKDSTQDTTGSQKAVTSIKSYNKKGDLKQEETVVYDDQWRVIQFGSDPHPYKYTYDENGNLLYRKTGDPGEVFIDEEDAYPIHAAGISYEYNSTGQAVKSLQWSGEGWCEETYTYDANGRRASSVEKYDAATYNSAYIYDSNDLLTKKETTIKGFDYTWLETTTYLYDSQNRITETKTEGGYSVTRYTYDYSHKPFTVSSYYIGDKLSSVSVSIDDSHGELITSLWIGDEDATYTTDADGYVTRIDTKGGYYEFSYESFSLPTFEYEPYEHFAREEWVKQHMEYAASSEYNNEITPGYRGKMANIFGSAQDDKSIKAYNLLKAIQDYCDDMDRDVTQADLYELLLVELMHSSLEENGAEENYAKNVHRATVDTLGQLCKGLTIAADLGSDTIKELTDLYDLMKTLPVGSTDFSKTYSLFIKKLNSNVSKEFMDNAFCLGVANTSAQILVDAALQQYNTAEDILLYVSNCKAYSSTCEEFKAILHALSTKVSSDLTAESFRELTDAEKKQNLNDFQTAINSFISGIEAYEKDGADALGRYAVERRHEGRETFDENAIKAIAKFAVNKLLSYVPVVGFIPAALAILDGGVLLIEVFTSVDNRAYSLDMMKKIYCVSVALDGVLDDLASNMSESDFFSTTCFDEGVNLYKATQLLASDYMVQYENALLRDAYMEYEKYENRTFLSPLDRQEREIFEMLKQRIQWFQNSLLLLQENITAIKNISCHGIELNYNPYTGETTYFPKGFDLNLYVIACPVTVAVTSNTGEQIAFLSNDACIVEDGYEMYYQTIKTATDSDEVLKIAFVPNGYTITITGTADGTMNVFAAECSSEGKSKISSFLNVPVKEGSTAYINAVSESNDQFTLVVDDTEYSEGDHHKEPLNLNWGAIISGIAVVISAAACVVTILNRKRKKTAP